MQRSVRLSLSLSGVAALALSNGSLLPAAAQEDGSADDLGVMSISCVLRTGFLLVFLPPFPEIFRVRER